MRRKHWRSVVLGASLFALGGCATSEEWDVWKSNSSHFASGQHFTFSMKNREGMAAVVTREDITLARQQNWFGRPVTVSQEQILER